MGIVRGGRGGGVGNASPLCFVTVDLVKQYERRAGLSSLLEFALQSTGIGSGVGVSCSRKILKICILLGSFQIQN